MTEQNTQSPEAALPPGSEIRQGEPAQAVSDDESTTERALARDVTTLIATVDQLGSEVDGLNVTVLAFVFMLGALAGVVFLQSRQIRELTLAVAG